MSDHKDHFSHVNKDESASSISSSDNLDRPFSEALDTTPLRALHTGKRTLTGADIRKVRDIKTREVWVKDWDGFATVKALTAKERDDFESSFVVKRGKTRDVSTANIRAKLVVRCLVNPDMTRMYTDSDAEWLGDKCAPAVNTLYEASAELSGITEADADELEKQLGNEVGAVSS